MSLSLSSITNDNCFLSNGVAGEFEFTGCVSLIGEELRLLKGDLEG